MNTPAARACAPLLLALVACAPSLDGKHACHTDDDCTPGRVCGGAQVCVPATDAGVADAGLGAGWTFDTAPDVGVARVSGPGAALAWTGADGDPQPGAALVTLDFTGASQMALFAINLDAPLDLAGATLSARIKLASGLSTNASFPGGAQLYTKTGATYSYANSARTDLRVADGWVSLTLDVSAPAYHDAATYDPRSVVELGIALASPMMGAAPATLFVDTVAYRF